MAEPALLAQSTSATVPQALARTEGTTVEPFVLGGFEGRTLVLIDRAQLAPLNSKPIQRLIFRRDAQTNPSLPGGMVGGWIELEVRASWTARSPRSPGARFSTNHDLSKGWTVVYKGEYRVIDSPALPPNTQVASFSPTVSAHIRLQSAIPFSASGNLCVEFIHRRHPTKAGPRLWLADMMEVANVSRRFFGESCWRAGALDRRAAKLNADASIGATLRCNTHGPTTALAVLLVGASNQQWGALRLPFDLGPYGAPGCKLLVSWDLVLTTSTRRYSNLPDPKANVDLLVPSDARLAGTRIYSQWLFFDPSANALSMTMTNGVSVALAPTPPNLGAGMVQAQSPSATTGRVYVNRAPVIRLEDR